MLGMAWDVYILGGGFGGLYAARKPERALPPLLEMPAVGGREPAAEPTVPR
jgi:NADH dehydrogenase FAD-containing subunit